MEDILLVIITLSILILIIYFLIKKPEKETVVNNEIIENNLNNLEEDETQIQTNNQNENRGARVQQQEIDPNKNYTKKELHKMEKKKDKADRREAEEEYRKQKKLREIEKEKSYLEKELKRKEEEAKEEEIIQKIREEKQKKEADEYSKWEKAFTVKEEGVEKVDFNDKIISEFINYVQIRKVVSLEDLAGTFKIATSEAAQRLKDLENCGRITGVIDDRGKYIYLTEKEIINIETFFAKKGRVSKSDLVAQCNKLIRFEPTEEDLQIIKNQNADLLKNFEEKESRQN